MDTVPKTHQALHRYGLQCLLYAQSIDPNSVQSQPGLLELYQERVRHYGMGSPSVPTKALRNPVFKSMPHITGPVLRAFPPHAPSPHAQGSSGAVATVPIAWRGHTNEHHHSARPNPDLAVWLE